MSTGNAVLWITPKWPLPPEDGARRASYNLINAAAAQGMTIDLLALAGDDETVDLNAIGRELKVRRVFVLRRPRRPGGFFSEMVRAVSCLLSNPALPLTMHNYGGRRIAAGVKEITAGDWRRVLHKKFKCGEGAVPDWGAVVYDGAHAASHRAVLGKFRNGEEHLPVFYRAHNREAQIWRRLARQSSFGPKKIFLSWQARLMSRFEDSLVAASAATLTVSNEDLDEFSCAHAVEKFAVVPIGFHFPGIKPLMDGSVGAGAIKQILFVGRLDWQPNSEGLIWFLKEVWPQVVKERSDLKLVVAGSGDYQALKPFLAQERVDFLGRVENLDELYASSVLCLVPVFYGSGTRVKAIEASRFGRPCLSTAVGVEGLGLEAGRSYYRAESAVEWVQCLTQLETSAALKIGEAAWGALRRRFELEETGRKFSAIVEKFLNNRRGEETSGADKAASAG